MLWAWLSLAGSGWRPALVLVKPVSGLDRVVVISFETEQPIGTVEIGRHPQRVRNGHVLVSALAPSAQ